jgi:hypothetical protein
VVPATIAVRDVIIQFVPMSNGPYKIGTKANGGGASENLNGMPLYVKFGKSLDYTSLLSGQSLNKFNWLSSTTYSELSAV